MTVFADMSAYGHAELTRPWKAAVNVGWLGPDAEIGGPVDAEFAAALLRVVFHHKVNLTRGRHRCPFCRARSVVADPVPGLPGERLHMGSAEAHFAGPDGTVYAVPTLIGHYVAEHGYRPPRRFVEAVHWVDARDG
ncbi:DUF7919 family protein [Actinokineospora spheciospongiae]|uniref:DUF7919 family protein n=1 Tax=Actinokineospora spheciospongiae TaxID=909613 RepID=UPI000D712413|nr:hypothetical protein [Actinokineospora spheciospongiae]PWW56185.1 hypothetical protein DFQ13_111120 [Actinokineospora spheciospongiae]